MDRSLRRSDEVAVSDDDAMVVPRLVRNANPGFERNGDGWRWMAIDDDDCIASGFD